MSTANLSGNTTRYHIMLFPLFIFIFLFLFWFFVYLLISFFFFLFLSFSSFSSFFFLGVFFFFGGGLNLRYLEDLMFFITYYANFILFLNKNLHKQTSNHLSLPQL